MGLWHYACVQTSIPDRGKGVFSSSLCVQTNSEAHTAIYLMDTVNPFQGVRAVGA
jgi:hypothetical protein